MEGHAVSFEPSGAHCLVSAGATLAEAAVLAGVSVRTPCGGLGTCGKCAVTVRGRLSDPDADEIALLGAERIASGVRLACRARVLGTASVAVASGSGLAVVSTSDTEAATVEPPEQRGIAGDGRLLGAAVDIGTTTVVAQLVDLRDGRTLATAAALNPQTAYGHDVMSRIAHAASAGVEALRAPLLATLDSLLARVLEEAGARRPELREIAACGNTTMMHSLLGIDPAPLGSAPYSPAFTSPAERTSASLGLGAPDPATRVYVLPGVSAFIGADVVAGLVATALDEKSRPTMLLDLGTNGEMVLRTAERMVGASAAAGPALEGAAISCGMLAEDGAIERVSGSAEGLSLGVIGRTAPAGLCGSGLLDLIALLLDAGVIDATGLLRPDAPHALAGRVGEQDGVRTFLVARGVVLTQHDVRQLQLAVAAVAAGIDITLRAAGLNPDAIDELIVAGGFGLHVDAGALVRLGVVPAQWRDRIRFAGNTALAGAVAVLLSGEARRRAAALARHVETIDLATYPGFQARFIAGMTFPQP